MPHIRKKLGHYLTCGTDYAALKAGPEEMFSDELILISTDQLAQAAISVFNKFALPPN